MNSVLDRIQANRKTVFIAVAVFLLIIFGLILLLPRGTSTTSTTPLAGDSIQTELIWWRPFHTQQTYQDVIQSFNKTYPNVKITVVNKPYGADYYKELIAAIAKGAGPDIFMIDNNDLPAYKDFLRPISLFQGSTLSNYRDSFADLVVKDTMDRDTVYGVATELENLQMYYNKDLLAQAGIALPATTWQEVADQAPKLTKIDANLELTQSAISLGHGGTRVNPDIGNIEQFNDIIPMFLMQNGDSIYDTQSNRSVLGDKADISFKALNTYLQFANPSEKAYTWSGNLRSNIELFSEGKLAYMVNYSYSAAQIKEKNARLNFAVAPIPQLKLDNKKTFGTFFMNGINRNLATQAEKDGLTSNAARKLKVTENFLYFLSLPENQQLVADKTLTPSANRTVLAKQQQLSTDVRFFATGALYADSYYQSCVDKTKKLWADLYFNVHYQTGAYQSGSSSRDVTDPRQIALKNAFNVTRQNYQTIVQQGVCLR